MPPIPVHTNSPINAAKAEGVTPKTAAGPEENGDSGVVQPGAFPAAAPTAPLQPTPTQKSTSGDMGPPPPQPGAVPVPYPAATRTATAPGPDSAYYVPPTGPQPPAPAPTQAPAMPAGGAGGLAYSPPTAPPPQMGMSLSEPAAPHTYRGTSSSTTATTAAAPLSGSLSGRQVGYTTADGPGGYGPGGYQQGGANNSSGFAGGYYPQTRGDGSNEDDGDEGGVWNSAVKWAQTAGEKLSAAESEVWKHINKE